VTRALLRAALTGRLADVPTQPDPMFGLAVPASCPGVPPELLMIWTGATAPTNWQNTPIMVDGLLYMSSGVECCRVGCGNRESRLVRRPAA